MVSQELVKQLGLDLSEAESQFLLSTEGQDELPASSRDLISVLAERIQLLINSSLHQEWPFLSPDILPDWLTAANRTIPSVSERQILLKCLLLALEEEDYGLASALAFVLDRFMYWYGGAKVILNVVSLIESRSPTTPVAPQLIIRKARVMKDTGDLHGAMRVLNEVHKMGFNVQGEDVNVVSGVPQGCWEYKSKAQYDNVCAVCLQIEGQILYNLGCMQDAIPLLLESVEGFEILPVKDTKGMSTSYGLLSKCLINLQPEDYSSLQQKYNSFTDQHPCYEAYHYGHRAAELCPPQPLFVARHYLASAAALLMFAVQQPDWVVRHQLLADVLSELKHSLSQHVTLQALQSREQCHEVLKALYQVSLVLMFSTNPDDVRLAWIIEELSIAVHTQFCRESGGLGNSQRSVDTTHLALSFLGIPHMKETVTGTTGGEARPTAEHGFPVSMPTLAKNEVEDVLPSVRAPDTGRGDQRVLDDLDLVGSEGIPSLQTELSENKKVGDVQINELRTKFEDVKCEDPSLELKYSVSKESNKNDEETGIHLRNVGLPASPTDRVYLSASPLLSVNHPESSDGCGADSDKVDTSATTICSTYTIEALKALENELTSVSSENSSSTEGTHSSCDSSSIEDSGYDTFEGDVAPTDHCQALLDFRRTTMTSAEQYRIVAQEQPFRSEGLITKLHQVNLVAQDNYQNNLNGTGSARGRLWRYDPYRKLWTAQSTLVYIGAPLVLPEGKKGKHRDALHVHFLHQEEGLGRYVAKRYRKVQPEPSHYLQDVESQMTARYFVIAFNQKVKALAADQTFTQIRYLPAAHLQVLTPDGQIKDFLNVEPYLEGDSEFVKLTNNYDYVNPKFKGEKLDTALAFTHFTHSISDGASMIVDLQGWLPADHSDVFYLTDPQFHTTGSGKFSPFDLKERGMAVFWDKVHPRCNKLCDLLQLQRPGS